RTPPPRRPSEACPAKTKAAPSLSPRPNRSWIVSAGTSIVSLTPMDTSRGSRSALGPAPRVRTDVAPSAMTTTSAATRSFGATRTPRIRPSSCQRPSTRIPVTRTAPASYAFFASHPSNFALSAVKLALRPCPSFGESNEIVRAVSSVRKAMFSWTTYRSTGQSFAQSGSRSWRAQEKMRPPNIPFTPGDRPRSTRRVENPLRARVRAAADPAGPAPTMMASKRSTVPSSHVGKAGRVKGFPRNSQRTQGPQLELATSVALGRTRRFLAEDFALEEIPSEARDLSGQEMAHGFLRAPVGARQRAVGDRQDEATMLRVEQGHLQPS